MIRSACLLAAGLLLTCQSAAWSQDQTPKTRAKLPAGVYAVLRDSLEEKEVLPLAEGEVLVVDRYKYVKKDEKEPPRFLVVRSAPDVALELAEKPKGVKEGDEVVRIFLKLQPKPATALEQLTRDRPGRQLAIILGGEVVSAHKIRGVIKNGDVQISSCTAGAAPYILEQLEAHYKNK